jgi:hypothetical protein
MATNVKFKRSAIEGKRPSISQLELGELALNTNDGRVFTRKYNVGIGSTVTLLNVWTENIGGGAYYTDGNIGIGTTNPTAKLDVAGDVRVTGVVTATTLTANSYNVGADVGISTTRTTVATTAATTIDSFAIATFRSARVQVQITQSTNYQTSDVLIIHNGTTANVVEYGSIATNDYLGTFSSTVSGGNCLLQINMSSATSSTVKVLSQRITV